MGGDEAVLVTEQICRVDRGTFGICIVRCIRIKFTAGYSDSVGVYPWCVVRDPQVNNGAAITA